MLFVTFSSNSSFLGLVLGGNIAVATDVFATRNSSAVNRSDTALQWPVQEHIAVSFYKWIV